MSRQERKEKKEQKLREKWKKQGFSEQEIEKLLESRHKKTIAKIVVGTLATAVVVAGIVFTVVKVVKNNQNNITPTPTPTPDPTPDPTPTPTPDPTPDPTPEEIEKSKELEEEIKNDVEDKKPEEIDTKIDDKQNELDQAKQELEDLKNSGASEEEIAKAEEKQQEAEKQLDAAKEEQSYWTVVSTIKDLYNKNLSNSKEYPNSYIRKINSIKESSNNFYLFVDVEIISKDSKNILRTHNVALKLSAMNETQNFKDAKGLSEFFNQCDKINFYMEFDSQNSEFATDVFNCFENLNNDKELLASKVEFDEDGKLNKLRIKTYGNNTTDYIEYSFKTFSKHFSYEEIAAMAKSGELVNYGIAYSKFARATDLDYDWENATIEYKGQKTEEQEEQQTEEQEAEEIVNSFKSLDGNGEETFDYPAYQQYLQQMEAEKEAKELEQNLTQETKVTYSEQELGF